MRSDGWMADMDAWRRRAVCGWAGVLVCGHFLSNPAAAQKPADRLRVAWRDAMPGLDPYRSQLRANLVLAHHVWDTLVYRDPDTFQLKPLLADKDWIEICRETGKQESVL